MNIEPNLSVPTIRTIWSGPKPSSGGTKGGPKPSAGGTKGGPKPGIAKSVRGGGPK